MIDKVLSLLGIRSARSPSRQAPKGLKTKKAGKPRKRPRSTAAKSTRRRERVASPRAFISFDFENDETRRMLFVGQSRNSSTPFDIEDWSSKAALPQSQWEAKIKEKIGRCHLMIVLVGRHMSSATGVAKELAFAQDLDVPFFGVYVDGAGKLTTLPAGLARNRIISWTWPGIASAIDQMMTEGKNKAG
jgi:hypothetical protein